MSELARRSRWCDQSILDERNSGFSSGPLRGRPVVWNSCRGNHLGQRSCGSAQTDPMRASGGEFIASAGEQPLEVRAMTQASSLSPLIPLDYENTLVLAIELSKTKWVLAAQVPGLLRVKAKQTIEPKTEALLAAIDGYRDRSKAAGRTVERVVAIYEASWSGFWLARWLGRHGAETHVVQPSSVPVDRRSRRAKSDGIDAELLLRTLLAWLRGEPRVCSMVPIPNEADEDERRRVREREDLVADRVSLVNRIGAVLATLGADDHNPLRRDRPARLENLRTALGDPLPPPARARILRLLDRLDLVCAQIAELEQERDAVLEKEAPDKVEKMIRQLVGLRAIGDPTLS